MIWYDMIRHGMIWCDMIWYDKWYNLTYQNMIFYVLIWYDMLCYVKHMQIGYYWVKDLIDRGLITIEYCPTEFMIADFL